MASEIVIDVHAHTEPVETHFSQEAEQSTIGAALQDSTVIAEFPQLTSDHFYDERHRAIWSAIVMERDAGGAVDAITVSERLADRGELDHVGRLKYLHALADSVPSSAHFHTYAAKVIEKFVRRQADAAAMTLTQRLREPGDVHAVVGDFVNRLSVIRDRAGTNGAHVGPMAALGQWFVTDEQVKTMKETRIIWRGLIASAHLIVWSAPANGGKTSLARLAAGEMATDGFTVLFFQEDASAGDLPALHAHAKNHGYQLLSSTLSGSSPDAQVKVLRDLAHGGAELEGFVLFFDTLKKYVDLMQKGGAREFFRMMRALTQRGATIVLLGHTNKHKGVDGKLIFEGVGDVRNDVDELFYLSATERDPAGIVTLTITPDKVRCDVRKATFLLDTNTMIVSTSDQVVDVDAILSQQRQMEHDTPVIASVRHALRKGGMHIVKLTEHVSKEVGQGFKAVRAVIDRYGSENVEDVEAQWIKTYMRMNNAVHVSLSPKRAP